MQSATLQCRKLRFESLESRRLLATSVTWIYWSEGPTIYRSLNGTQPAETVIQLDPRYDYIYFDIHPQDGQIVVGASSGHAPLFVTRANEDGSEPVTLNDRDLGTIVQAIAIDPTDRSVFVSPHHLMANSPGSTPGGMRKLSADGKSVATFSQRPFYVPDMQVVPELGQVIYSTYPTYGGAPFGFTGLRKMNPDGTGDSPLFSTGQGSYFAIDAVAGKAYFTKQLHYDGSTNRTIYRSNLDGGGAAPLIQEPLGQIGDVDLDASRTRLYWNVSSNDGTRWLRSANVDGTGLVTVRQLGSFVGPTLGLYSTTVNLPPSIDEITNLSLAEDAGIQTIPISGVTPGGTESQPLRVTATSSLPELIPHPDVRMLRSLDNPTLVTAGNTTRAVTVGDWNGDSHPDIAATNQVAGNLSVSFGNGKGSFSEILSLPMNQAPSFAVADDFNLDGFDDIVVSNSQNNLVTVRLGNAQGTFSPAASFPTGNGDVDPVSSGVHALATGDFNQDGRIDLIATNIIHDFVSILPGNGAGGFGTPVQTLLGPTGNTPPQPDGPSGIVPGDFNRDGFLDAAIAILGNGTVRILLGNGNGNFTSTSGYQIGSRAKAIDTADFNGDSILDLAVINDLDSQVTILLGSGSGTFTPLSQLFAGAGSQHITSGDLDQDGRHDLIASATNSRTFLLRGLGNGQFQPPVQLAYDTSERTINNSLVVDLNHDQFPEVVSAISNESQIGAIGVLWNQQATSGLLTLQPLPQQSGAATIFVRVEDPGLDERFDTPQDNGITTRQFVVTVQRVNDPPTAVDDEATLFVEQSMLLDLLSNDFDLDDGLNPGSIELMQLPQGGTARVSEGKVLYVPNQQQIGVDSFTYRVQDLGGNWSREAVVRLNLLERPVGVDDSVQTPRDTSISIDVTANDRVKMSPIDRTTLTIIQPPLVGTATVTNGMIEFSPPLFYLGEVRFRYLVANNQGVETNPTEVVVTVAGSRLQNILYPVDVNANGTVTAIDALLVINELNLNGSRPVELIAGAAPPFYDVSGDFQVSALDALLVINHLNLFGSGPIGDGEGELSLDATDSTLSIEFHRTDLLHDLALLAWLEDPLRERLTPHRTGNFKGGVHSQPVKGNQSTT